MTDVPIVALDYAARLGGWMAAHTEDNATVPGSNPTPLQPFGALPPKMA
jgi:hypothetical protein